MTEDWRKRAIVVSVARSGGNKYGSGFMPTVYGIRRKKKGEWIYVKIATPLRGRSTEKLARADAIDLAATLSVPAMSFLGALHNNPVDFKLTPPTCCVYHKLVGMNNLGCSGLPEPEKS